MSMRTVFTGKRLAEMIDHAVKAAIVTAGAIGIGRGIAGAHGVGAAVLLADLDGEKVGAVAGRFNAAGGNSALAIRAGATACTDVGALSPRRSITSAARTSTKTRW